MKKGLKVIAILLKMITIVGCSNKEKQNKKVEDKELRVVLNDNIKADSTINKIGDNRFVQIKFDRKKENEKLKIVLKYYQNSSKKSVYEDNIIYTFPKKEIECLLDIPIAEYYYDMDGNTINVRYDYLKLEISEYKGE